MSDPAGSNTMNPQVIDMLSSNKMFVSACTKMDQLIKL